MGGHPYWYVVPYEADADAALQKLRLRELRAGRYNPVTPFPDFPVNPASPGPGGQHPDFDTALFDADADGTRSIIDLARASPDPWDGNSEPFMTAWRIADADLAVMTSAVEPTLEQVLEADDLWETMERGSGVWAVLREGGRPMQLFFAGCSFD